jgi:hypothetical protein
MSADNPTFSQLRLNRYIQSGHECCEDVDRILEGEGYEEPRHGERQQ